MHEKFIHGTQKFVYLLVYLTGGSSFEVISLIYCRDTSGGLYSGVHFLIFVITKPIDKFEYIYIAIRMGTC